jgi:tetratricopeptide (TPR) repeat protein
MLALLALWSAAGAAPEEVAQLLAAGGRALEIDDLETAQARFSEALLESPQTALAWFGLSEVFERRGDLIEALRHARQAERLAPNDPGVLLAVSRQLHRLGRFEESLESLSRLRELEPQRPEGYLLAASVLRRRGEAGAAIRLLESGHDRGVRSSRLSEELTLLLLAQGEIERARLVAEAGLIGFEDDGGLRGAMGLALAADPERRFEAIGWMEEALELEIAAPETIHLELATILLEQGESSGALEHLRAAAALQPDLPEVHYRLATALRSTGDLDGARKALGRYQELTRAAQQAARVESTVATRFNEAQSLANQNRLDEALAELEALLSEQPAQDRALALKGKVLLSLGRGDEALVAIVAARQAVESQVEYHYLEGLFLLQLGRSQEAELPLRRALTLDGELAEGYALLGMMLSSQERYEEAVEQFERALELGAESPGLRLGFAEALRGVGRQEDSEEQMEAYRRLTEE